MKKIKVGVMGCAKIALRSVIPAIQSIDGFELVAIASRSQEKAAAAAQKFNCEAIEGYQNLLDRADIEMIYMPLPTGLHDEWMHKTLEAGKHILVEKSLASTEESAQKVVEKARKKCLLLMENFMFQYHSQHAFVKKMIADGLIGEVRLFRSSFGFPPLPNDNFRYDKALGGGALLDAATYTIKASQLFLGYDLSVKAANLSQPEGSEVELYGGAYLSNPAGQIAEVGFGFDNFYQCNYEIWGSKGKITADRAFTPGATFKPKIILEQQDHYQEFHVKAENHFVNLLKAFLAILQEKSAAKEALFEAQYAEILHQSRLLEEVRTLGMRKK